ncbi:aspartyl-phosphate phosphatase Spo0E family protein [Sporosarcina sp. resist]|uniref:aspartyl-phosphate phosphatase Spo0E family protein n=1 Tax=Sporosarcina sp. resist TaxID=2762563 RepID=UPI00164D3A30|nr:aspartyl-phosphate phosphatase Spo0E family protein [Sporosarcina sp. resist]QNK87772.1 aspartyl-phosphate phosphatase Spo0E family protein [Sporosarcina sp. resist]
MTNKKLEDMDNQIEKVRKQLNDLAKEKPLSDPKVVETSQLLDLLLNEYERLKNNKS